jgi:subtilase family serine protease
LACLFAFVLPAQPNRIPTEVNARDAAIVRGSVHPQAQPKNDLGAVEADFRLGNMTLVLRPSAEQQAALEELLAAQQDPASPEFRNWLTPETYAERFGASQADLDKIAEWLRSRGFSIEYTARGRDFISFGGSAGQVQAALQTEIHRYRVGTETHFANATEVSLPAAIAPMVAGVLGLHDFHPIPLRKRARPLYTDTDGSHYLMPTDFATVYNLIPLQSYGYMGAGQKIAIVGESDVHTSDIASFRETAGIPATTVQMVSVGTYPKFNDAEDEGDLDLEWAGAVAPGATLIYIYSTDADYSAYYAIDNDVAPVLSESYGMCEYNAGMARRGLYYYQVEAQKGNALGITWLAASGDAGAATCDPDATMAAHGLGVSLPASIPEVTAVGGTEFNEGSRTYWSGTNGPYDSSALSYIPEVAWNDTAASLTAGYGLAASGGGLSLIYDRPAWQTGPGVPSGTARLVPDVSLNASPIHDPYIIVSDGVAEAVGGTSAAAPAFAGIVAVLNEYLVRNNIQAKPGLGNINPRLYAMAAAGTPGVFHDITTGDNIVPCEPRTWDCVDGRLGFTAGVGYDMVTGLGSVDAYKLITAWDAIPVAATTMTLAANPSTVAATGSTVLTATVKASSGSASPTGSVTFTLGGNTLGTTALSGSGGTATASITIYGGQLTGASNTVQAYYGGSPAFGASSATATIVVATPAAVAAVVASVTPNPVYQQTALANGATFVFSIHLNETAGVATTVTGFNFDGVDFSSSIAAFFGGTSLPANGSLTAKLNAGNVPVPASVPMVFTGRDASGAMWTERIAVQFLPRATN